MAGISAVMQAQSPELVLSELPGWENATIREIHGGLTNRTWLVEANARRAVLKIDGSPRGLPFNSRWEEAQIQARAANFGLATSVLLATDTLYMTEYAEGVVWSGCSLQDRANLESLAAVLRKLHALPLTGRTFDALAAASTYACGVGSGAEQKASKCLATIEAAPRPHNLCCCHNDLVAANIIGMPEPLLLDWEYACDNDPLFDLATIVAHHKLSSGLRDYFLDAYFGGDSQHWRERFARQVGIYEALAWLWQASRSPVVAKFS